MPQLQPTSSELLTLRETAEKLRVSRATVYRRIGDGQILAVRLGGPGTSLRVPASELDRWIYRAPEEADR